MICVHGHHKGASCGDWRAHLPVFAEAGFWAVALTLPGFRSDRDHASEGAVLPERPDLVLMPGGAAAAVLDLVALLHHSSRGLADQVA